MTEEKEVKSYVEQDGEWRTRKITIMGVVRSFVSQLRPGQDLTKVSLPAIMLFPFSLLEVMGSRELSYYDKLLEINKGVDGLDRMIAVSNWFLCTIQQEGFYKKPYNPVQGEVHHCWSISKEHGKTFFMGEQVSHHPPVSAFVVNNEDSGTSLTGNISFGVRFNRNSVSVVTEGTGLLNAPNFGETYELTKMTPNMLIKNVIWGTKKIFWDGDVTISCPQTRYSATLQFGEDNNDNILKGSIIRFNVDGEGEEIMSFEGKCGGLITITSSTSSKYPAKKVLIDVENIDRAIFHYPPKSELDPLDSLNIWEEVSHSIVINDMVKADDAKKQVEADQRERAAQRKLDGIETESKFFSPTEDGWLYKGELKKKKTKKLKKRSKKFDSDPSKDGSGSDTEKHKKRHDEKISEEKNQEKILIHEERKNDEKHNDEKERKLEVPHEKPHEEEKKKQEDKRSPSLDKKPTEEKDKKPTEEKKQIEEKLKHEDEDAQKTPKIKRKSDPLKRLSLSKKQIEGFPPKEQLSDDRDPPEYDTPTLNDTDSVTPLGESPQHKQKGRFNSLNPLNHLKFLETSQEKKLKQEEYKLEKNRIKDERKRQKVESRFPVKLSPLSVTPEEIHFNGWMRMRNSMKIWVNRWCVLCSGKLVYYKSDQDMSKGKCAGILRLAHCTVNERPLDKDGYSFKIYHLLHYPIYHKYGLKGETLKLAMLPVSWNYCIFRVSSDKERRTWMDAITEQITYANEWDLTTPKESDELPVVHSVSDSEEEEFENLEKESDTHDYKESDTHEEKEISVKKENPLELSDNIVGHEDFQQNLLNGLNSLQKSTSTRLQKKTIRAVEEWKDEISAKLSKIEKQLLNGMKQNSLNSHKGGINLSYWQFCGFIVLVILLSKFL